MYIYIYVTYYNYIKKDILYVMYYIICVVKTLLFKVNRVFYNPVMRGVCHKFSSLFFFVTVWNLCFCPSSHFLQHQGHISSQHHVISELFCHAQLLFRVAGRVERLSNIGVHPVENVMHSKDAPTCCKISTPGTGFQIEGDLQIEVIVFWFQLNNWSNLTSICLVMLNFS